MKNILFIVLTFMSIGSFAQSKEGKEALKATMNSKKLTYQGNESLEGDKPIRAGVDYYNAIAEDDTDLAAQYNLGTLLYKQENYGEASTQLMRAANAKQMSEAERHQIFHNLGNASMKEKTYDKVVLAYRGAFRYNPTNGGARYNLVVANEMLKKNPPKNNNKDNKDNKDNKSNKDNKGSKGESRDNKDNKGKNQDEKDDRNKNKDNKDNKDDKDKNRDNKDKDNKGNKDKDKDNRNSKDKDNRDQDKNNKGDQQGSKEQGGQPRPSPLSPGQMERILETMNNEERKTQDKVNGQKVRGQRAKSKED